MARLRLLLALGLMAIGTMFGALALSGYYNLHAPRGGQPMVASITSSEGAAFIRPRPRQRFVAAEVPVMATPPKSKPVKQLPSEAKPKAKDKDKRPQQAAAAQWPWNLFGN